VLEVTRVIVRKNKYVNQTKGWADVELDHTILIRNYQIYESHGEIIVHSPGSRSKVAAVKAKAVEIYDQDLKDHIEREILEQFNSEKDL